MTEVIVGVLGFVLGLAAHDLAIQGLTDDQPLRPLVGICPGCGHRRGWLHIRCSECGRSIAREPLLVGATTVVALGFLNTVGLKWALVAYLGFLVLSAALVVSDLEAFRIVDRLNLRGTAVLVLLLAVASLADSNVEALWRGLLGGLAYFVGSTLVWLAVRGRGFGAGDVKLAPQLGLFATYVSWGALGWSVFGTAVIGGVLALVLIVFGTAGMKTELPYGPPMVLGAWLAVILAGLGAFPVPT